MTRNELEQLWADDAITMADYLDALAEITSHQGNTPYTIVTEAGRIYSRVNRDAVLAHLWIAAQNQRVITVLGASPDDWRDLCASAGYTDPTAAQIDTQLQALSDH